jgi:hypothetical protein
LATSALWLRREHEKKARRRARREDQQTRPENCAKARTQKFEQENLMTSSKIRNTLLVSVLVGTGIAIGCSSVDGNYRDSDGTVTLELKDGKCNQTFGPERIPCTYKVDGDKVTLSPTIGDKSQTIV